MTDPTRTFDGKIAWITGASSGTGKALALALAQQGARLVLSARSAADLAEVADLCAGTRPLVIPLDVTDADARATAVAQVLNTVEGVDFLFNNAGVAQRATALDTSLDIVRAIMELNFFAPVALTKLVLPSMIARQTGMIVLTSSIGGKFGAPMRSSYAASKHAMHGYFEALRIEQQANNILVSFLLIGSVQTDIVAKALTADGTPWGVTDQGHLNGMPPEEFARQALAGLSRAEHEIFIGSRVEESLIRLKREAPDRLTSQLASLYAMPKSA